MTNRIASLQIVGQHNLIRLQQDPETFTLCFNRISQ